MKAALAYLIGRFERGLCPRNPGGRHGGARREACDDGRKGGEAPRRVCEAPLRVCKAPLRVL